jgi:succinate dehydrogenase/fumarate reductase cytochrome b subunit
VIWIYVGYATITGLPDFHWYRWVVPIIVSICFVASGISLIVVHYTVNKKFQKYTKETFEQLKSKGKLTTYDEGVSWLVLHEIIMLVCSAVAKQTTLFLVFGAFMTL